MHNHTMHPLRTEVSHSIDADTKNAVGRTAQPAEGVCGPSAADRASGRGIDLGSCLRSRPVRGRSIAPGEAVR